MNSEPTVFVIDDDGAVRDSLAYLIESTGLSVQTFPDARAFLEAYDGRCAAMAGCLVLDMRLPGMSGLELQETLAAQGVRLPVIVITGHGDVPAAVRAMKAGAVDFVEKPFDDSRLLDRIQEALVRNSQQRELDLHREQVLQRAVRLTRRERQVMMMVVAGKLNKQIASELGLSPKTVEVHRAHVMEKMQARSLAELVRMAILSQDEDELPVGIEAMGDEPEI